MAGSFDIRDVAGVRILSVDSDRIAECVRHYREERPDYLEVNPLRGYRRTDLEFLREFPDIASLLIVASPMPFDLRPLEALTGLRALRLNFPVKALHLDRFRELVEFRGYSAPGLGLDGCRKLQTLDLTGLKTRSRDLTSLPDFPELRELTLVQGNFRTLKGVARYTRLRRLELAGITRLESLEDIEGLAMLDTLGCQGCRKLQDHGRAQALPSLKTVRFNDCGTIPTLRFLDHLPRLEEFRFVNTNIEDGDLSPLLRLKRVGFSNKKHFSHTPEQLDAILRPRGGSAIARLE